MALLSLLASNPNFSEGSQIIPTINTLIEEINTTLSLFAGSGGSFVANNTVATALGSNGPVGSRTAPVQWLEVTNAAGGALFIPCF